MVRNFEDEEIFYFRILGEKSIGGEAIESNFKNALRELVLEIKKFEE